MEKLVFSEMSLFSYGHKNNTHGQFNGSPLSKSA